MKKIDVFCVGGGGAGGIQGGYIYSDPNKSGNKYHTELHGGGGGGGGYTNTMKNVVVTPGQQLSVVVGDGSTIGGFSTSPGGDSSVTIDSGSTISASGGKVGYQNGGDMINCSYVESGSCGGSGGGHGSEYSTDWSSSVSYEMFAPASTFPTFDNGGKDGGIGGNFWRAGQSQAAYEATFTGDNSYYKGQGTTTRYFGESTGTLYSNGGSGGNLNSNFFGTTPSANTGGGGNGGPNGGINSTFSQFNVYNYDGSKGASGIAIIRWGK